MCTLLRLFVAVLSLCCSSGLSLVVERGAALSGWCAGFSLQRLLLGARALELRAAVAAAPGLSRLAHGLEWESSQTGG